MKAYNIYKNPFGMLEAVKIGWSWPAFLIPGFWLIAKQLWVIVGIFWTIILTWFFIELLVLDPYYIDMGMYDEYYYGYDMYRNSFDRAVNMGFAIGSGVFFGIQGNQFVENNLMNQGYVSQCTINATSPQFALSLYLQGESTNSTKKRPRRSPTTKHNNKIGGSDNVKKYPEGKKNY
tara:strand:- start:3814 stop:4344 length:531 start_codon:yes stop_codon:yes gene_type:complete